MIAVGAVAGAIAANQLSDRFQWPLWTVVAVLFVCLVFGVVVEARDTIPSPPERDRAPASNLHHPQVAPDRHFVLRQGIAGRLDAVTADDLGLRNHALIGPGGVGKSEMARWWARRCLRSGAAVVWWLNASSASTLHAGFAELAAVLGLPNASTLRETTTNISRTLAGLNGSWLVVLDNADDLDLLVDSMPSAPNGMTLVTTRDEHPGLLLGTVDVHLDEFTEDEALAFLDLAVGQGRGDHARSICRRLGRLPLALDQAAAYIQVEKLDLASYDRLIAADLELWVNQSVAQHQRTISTLWNHVLAKLSAQAKHVLSCAAVLAPDTDISIDLLGAATGSDVRPLLLEAGRYHLFSRRRTGGEDTVQIHELTQFAIRAHAGVERMTAEVDTARALRWLTSELNPRDPSHWHTWSIAAAHADALLRSRPSLRAPMSDLLLGIGRWHVATGHVGSAMDLMMSGLTSGTSGTVPFDPEKLSELALLAEAKWEDSNFVEAIEIEEQILQHVRLNPGDDPAVLVEAITNLGVSYLDAGILSQALDLLEEALASSRRLLPAEAQATREVLSNLALAVFKDGDVDRAVELGEDAKAGFDQHQPGTLDQLTASANLAMYYEHAGRPRESIHLGRIVLERRATMLGADHPQTLQSQHNLASALFETGAHSEAVGLERDALRLLTRSGVAPTNTKHIESSIGLMWMLGSSGGVTEALDIGHDTLRHAKALRADRSHPLVFSVHHRLATCFVADSKLLKARSHAEAALRGRREQLKADHPDLTTSEQLPRSIETQLRTGEPQAEA